MLGIFNSFAPSAKTDACLQTWQKSFSSDPIATESSKSGVFLGIGQQTWHGCPFGFPFQPQKKGVPTQKGRTHLLPILNLVRSRAPGREFALALVPLILAGPAMRLFARRSGSHAHPEGASRFAF